MVVFVLWKVSEEKKSRDEELVDMVVGHLEGNLARWGNDEIEGYDTPVVNISYEKEINMWNVVTFKRSLLEMNKVQREYR